jgi:hypothetical protein
MAISGSVRLQGTRPGQRLSRTGSVVCLLLMVAACGAPRPLAVPEQILALRTDLPLDDVRRKDIVQFIAAGGRRTGGDTAATPIPAVEKDFGTWLDLLKDPRNLAFSGFASRLSSTVPLGDPEAPVIDAREEYPDELGRVAFLVHNFWFVLYASKESPEGDPLPVEAWTFTKMAVFRDRPRE